MKRTSTLQARDITTRTYQVRISTLDVKNRSVDAVIATEERVLVLDWNRFEIVEEILLMAGCRLPADGQVPLLDSHDRSSVQKQLGSTQNLRIEGDQLIGRNFFSDSPAAEHPWTLVRQGHLKSNSIGYQVIHSKMVKAGAEEIIGGRTFRASADRDLRVSTNWEVKENSVCAIGADKNAQNRRQDMIFEEWLETKGFKRADLDDNQLAVLQDAYNVDPANIGERLDRGIGRTKTATATAEDERNRIAAIRELAGEDVPVDIIERCITEDKSVEEAKAMILDSIRDARPHVNAVSVMVGDDLNRASLPAAISDAILTRAGVKLLKENELGEPVLDENGKAEYRQPHESSRRLLSMRIPDMARQLLIADGRADAGAYSDQQAIRVCLSEVQQSRRSSSGGISTLVLSEILGDSMNKSLLAAYFEYPVQWPKFCKKEMHNNFQEITRVRLSELDTLAQIGSGGEYTYASVGEEAEKYTLAKFGKIFGLSMEQMINDNLHAFSQVPRKLGLTARRIEDVLAFGVITLNAAMSDNVALFHADHGNLAAGAVISTTTLNAAKLAFRKQIGKSEDSGTSAYLNLVPAILIVPPELEGTAEMMLSSEYDPADEYHKKANIWQGKLELCVHPILSATSLTAWHLTTTPGHGGIEMCFLNGAQIPHLERELGFENDTLRWKVRHICAAKAIDYRALYRDPGA